MELFGSKLGFELSYMTVGVGEPYNLKMQVVVMMTLASFGGEDSNKPVCQALLLVLDAQEWKVFS